MLVEQSSEVPRLFDAHRAVVAADGGEFRVVHVVGGKGAQGRLFNVGAEGVDQVVAAGLLDDVFALSPVGGGVGIDLQDVRPRHDHIGGAAVQVDVAAQAEVAPGILEVELSQGRGPGGRSGGQNHHGRQYDGRDGWAAPGAAR